MLPSVSSANAGTVSVGRGVKLNHMGAVSTATTPLNLTYTMSIGTRQQRLLERFTTQVQQNN